MFAFTFWCESKLLYLICLHCECATIRRVRPTALLVFFGILWNIFLDQTPESLSVSVSSEFWKTSSRWILIPQFLLPSGVPDSVSFRGSTVAVIFLLYKNGALWSKQELQRGACTCLASPCPSSLFRILGSVLGKWGSWPWLSASPGSHIVSSWSRGTRMESTLSRRFSNYTLETNQPEHCFLISRTKQ